MSAKRVSANDKQVTLSEPVSYIRECMSDRAIPHPFGWGRFTTTAGHCRNAQVAIWEKKNAPSSV